MRPLPRRDDRGPPQTAAVTTSARRKSVQHNRYCLRKESANARPYRDRPLGEYAIREPRLFIERDQTVPCVRYPAGNSRSLQRLAPNPMRSKAIHLHYGPGWLWCVLRHCVSKLRRHLALVAVGAGQATMSAPRRSATAPSVRRCCSTLAAGARSTSARTVGVKRSPRPTGAPASVRTGS